jgi:hypothetical protein
METRGFRLRVSSPEGVHLRHVYEEGEQLDLENRDYFLGSNLETVQMGLEREQYVGIVGNGAQNIRGYHARIVEWNDIFQKEVKGVDCFYEPKHNFALIDLNTQTGTQLNGEKIESDKLYELKGGDKITLADSVEIEFSIIEE